MRWVEMLAGALIALYVATPLAAAPMSDATYNRRVPGVSAEPVSLVAVIANPAAYDGRRVMLDGYLNIEFEDSALFLSKTDHDLFFHKNGIMFDPPRDISRPHRAALSGRYATIEGVFVADKAPYTWGYSGSITDVTFVSPALSREEWNREARNYVAPEEGRDAVLMGIALTLSLGVAFAAGRMAMRRG